jgi:hypothetical protein
LSAGAAFKNVYSHIKATGSSANLNQPLHDFQDFSKLMGFDWVADFDKSHAAEAVKS